MLDKYHRERKDMKFSSGEIELRPTRDMPCRSSRDHAFRSTARFRLAISRTQQIPRADG
jgi:hypothetical protein